MKEKILKFMCENQVTESDRLTRGEGYDGFYLNDDDCPLCTYSYINDGTMDLKEMKAAMIEMRNDGLVELLNAVDCDGMPNGSGWSLTEKGLKYCVENKLIIKENS